MTNKKTLILVALALALLLAAAVVAYGILGQKAVTGQTADILGAVPVESGQAPDFTVYDLDGKEVQLSDYVGKPIVINFWASWCGPCREEMPEFEEASFDLRVGQISQIIETAYGYHIIKKQELPEINEEIKASVANTIYNNILTEKYNNLKENYEINVNLSL